MFLLFSSSHNKPPKVYLSNFRGSSHITQQAAVQEKLTRELKEVTEKLNEKTNENNALKVYIAQLEQQLLAMHAQNPMVQVTVDQKNHVSQSERTKTEFNNPMTIDKAQDVVAQGGTKHVA